MPTLGRLEGLEAGRAAGGSERSETMLSLSGAGYRAALFHLGALTRLNELGLLARVDTVGAVAGGSILAALLVGRVPWPLSGAFRDWPEMVAEPMRGVARRNARAREFLRSAISANRAAEAVLEERYARELAKSLGAQPPARPQFVFGGAGLVLGEMGIEGAGGLSWEIGVAASPPGYDEALVKEVIEAVRTDLDAFGDAEQAVLENHGYLLADAAVRDWGREKIGGVEPLPPEPPHPQWMNEERVREALATSSRRTRLGRLRPRRLAQPTYTPEPASTELTALLERWRPYVQYDSLESCHADSVALITDFAMGRRRNALHRADGTLIAAVVPAGEEAQLSLDFLRGPAYPNGLPALEDDYLDECGGSHATDARLLRKHEGYADVVYGHARHDVDGLWLQYWFFYYYNDKGLLNIGLHEGDWEMVQLRLGPDGKPEEVTYGQHAGGERAGWEMVECQQAEEGPAPVVYPARGSHASRLRAGSHEAPFVPDHNDGLGPRVRPRLVTIADDGPAWVTWPGRWGSTRRRESFEADSPRGPREHPQWWRPEAFHREAKPARAIPIGETATMSLPAAPAPRLSAQRDGNHVSVSYGFPEVGREEGRPARIVVAAYGAERTGLLVTQSFAVEGHEGSFTLQTPPGEKPLGIRASVASAYGVPSEAIAIPFK